MIILLLLVGNHIAIADGLGRESVLRQVLLELAPVGIDRYEQHVSDDNDGIFRTFYRYVSDEDSEILERAVLDFDPIHALLGASIDFVVRTVGPPESVLVLVTDQYRTISFEYGGVSLVFAFDEPIIHQITVSDRIRADFAYEGLVRIGITADQIVDVIPETTDIVHGQEPDFRLHPNRIFLNTPDRDGRGRVYYPDRDLMLFFDGDTVDAIAIWGGAEQGRRVAR